MANANNTDWVDETVHTGLKHGYTFGAAKGGEKLSTQMNISYDDNGSYLRGNNFVRTTGRLNMDYKAAKWLKLGFNSSLSSGVNNRVNAAWSGGLGAAMSTALPIYPIKNADGTWYRGGSNPVRDMNNMKWRTEELRALNGISVDITPVKNLIVRGQASYDYMNLQDDQWRSSEITGQANDGDAYRGMAFVKNFNYYVTATYLSKIGENHSFSVMGGNEFQRANTLRRRTFASNVPDMYVNSPEFLLTSPIYVDNGTNWAFLSYFGRANYDYKGKINVQAVYRVDASSRFGENYRWATFPSLSAGWILSEEKFLKDTLMYLKNLGVNVLELMPINEFDGNESWGYNPNFFFAVDKYYGTKDAFKALVDECHKLGIAVVLDMVLNHSFGLNPQVRMYFNSTTGKPENNPWFNSDATHPFNVGYDYNHESQDTKDFVDRVLKYWATEYKVDGYRFDLSKGFTQKNTGSDVGAWSAYDQSRVNLWKRIRDEFRKTCTDCYLILEHLGDNSEETVLANEGFIMWGKMTEQFNEATMGYSGAKQNLSWGNYKSRNFTFPNLVTYAESHDEERLMFKNKSYGNVNGTYSVKNLNTGLQRMGAAMAMLLPLKGPKMIWQFGELGYDISIDQNGRTGNKPILWNYNTEPARKQLYNTTAALAKLKQHPSFGSDNYTYDVAGTGKFLKVSDATMNSITIANFDMNSITMNPVFQKTGWWYDYMTGDSIQITDVNAGITLNPGEFKVYTDVNLNPKTKPSSISNAGEETVLLNVFPNPAQSKVTVVLNNRIETPEINLFDVNGRLLNIPISINQRGQNEWICDLDLNDISQGIYFIQVKTNDKTELKQLIISQ